MDASLRTAQRLLGSLAPPVRATDGPGPTLETLPAPAESPRLVKVQSVEGTTLGARAVPGAPETAFAAFLDGVQTSHVAGHWGIFPIIHGRAAAVVRQRHNRRLTTWEQLAPPASIYMPCAFVPTAVLEGLASGPFRLVDTTPPDPEGGEDAAGPHPMALAERAVHFVQAERERLERSLAERWCRTQEAPLYIDGGIGGSEPVATSATSVGVVRRHRTLYVGFDRFPVVANLGPGERTTAFQIALAGRTPVLSWYLRLRDAAGRDPLWGLVRVEVAELDAERVRERADEVSRWIMAERAPVALPDSGWHGLAYGVHDCEEFLRATI